MARDRLVNEVAVHHARIPAGLDGLRILFISDMHFAGRVKKVMRRASEIAREQRPDVVVLGGDMLNHPGWWEQAAVWLRTFEGPKYKVGVPGNWEYKRGASLSDFREGMTSGGFLPLCNESVVCTFEGGRMNIVGLDDVRHGKPDPRMALEGVDRALFTLTVCHNPDILLQMDPKGFDLLLCGHTHGGQIRIPGFGAIITSTRLWKKYEAGLYSVGEGSYVYVTRGLGSVLTGRLFCPPEVSLIRLCRKEAPSK